MHGKKKKKKLINSPHCPFEAQISILQSTGVWIAGCASAFLALRHIFQCRRYVCKLFCMLSFVNCYHDESAFSLQNRCD